MSSKMKIKSMQQNYGVVLALLSLSALATRAQQQTGFISIDCGSKAAYPDAVTGINWVPDTGYIDVGTNVEGVAINALTNNSAQLSTLRYFNEPRSKYCYVLPAVAKSLYLIRQTYWYGSYDNAAAPPTFNASIDSTDVGTINPTDPNIFYWFENLYIAVGSTISFCLHRSSATGGNPFISSLELRLMESTAYIDKLQMGNLLRLYARKNYGGPLVRFPDDIFDRIWYASSSPSLSPLSTTLPVSTGFNIKPPMKVLQTALTPPTFSSLVVNFPDQSQLQDCATDLFFAEINSSATIMSRVFNISIPNAFYVENIFNATGGLYKSHSVHINWTLNATTNVTLTPIPGSVLPPLLSASESWLVLPSTAATNAADVTAFEAFKANTSLTGWPGDPCLPVAIDWVACSASSPPRITALTLSNYSLSGPIPTSIGNLTALTNIFLDNNMLTGPIPDLGKLTSLVTLHLQNNGLTGSIPASLGSLTTLTELFVQNNKLTGSVPSSLQRPNLNLNIAGNPGLNGSGPSLAPVGPPGPPSPSTPSPSNIGVIAGAVGGGGAAMLLIGGLILFFVCRCRKTKDGGDKTPILATNNMKKGAPRLGPKAPEGSVQNQGAKDYSLRDVRAATQDFKTKIGEGGFGPVYYGKLADGQEVAVKVSDINSRQGAQEFYNEVDLLSRVHHRNLVSLVGYCQEDNRQMLIYEFLHKGTVREHLYGNSKATSEPLDWKMRLDIAVNAAQGLEYLHTGCSPSIIHRDIKSSNILLTNKYVAKVADFGLSKLAPEDGATHVSTVVKGTAGYLDPEYWSSNSLSEKSDVFSFGVVLLELICGRVPIDNTLPDQNHWNICDFVRSMLQVGDIERILDPPLAACHPNMDSVWKVAEIAIQSVEPRGVHRPVMRDVVRELRDAISLECSQGGTTVHLQGSAIDVHGQQSPHGGPPYSDISENSSTFDSTLGLPQGR